MKFSSQARECPKCHKSWVAGEIPEKDKHLFAGEFFSHLIGIETAEYDGTSEWMCPFCKQRWRRWTSEEISNV